MRSHALAFVLSLLGVVLLGMGGIVTPFCAHAVSAGYSAAVWPAWVLIGQGYATLLARKASARFEPWGTMMEEER